MSIFCTKKSLAESGGLVNCGVGRPESTQLKYFILITKYDKILGAWLVPVGGAPFEGARALASAQLLEQRPRRHFFHLDDAPVPTHVAPVVVVFAPVI